jgi:hypothetical protein
MNAPEHDVTQTYTPEQAFARDLLITAVNGGINRWARVHGYLIDAPAEHIRAEGIDTNDRSVWSITLADLNTAIDKLISDPAQCADPSSGIDPELIGSVSEILTDARERRIASLTAIRIVPTRHTDAIAQIVADVVFQVAVADEVIY